MDYTTSRSWPDREPIYRKFLSELAPEALLREATLRWWEGLQHQPMWREDQIMLAILCQEHEARAGWPHGSPA
jgi:hypothetical protein